jgi:hypothetical protein
LTPRQFWALARRAQLKQRHNDLQIAVVAAVVSNAFFKRDRPYMPEEFSISAAQEPEDPRAGWQSPEEQIKRAREIFGKGE